MDSHLLKAVAEGDTLERTLQVIPVAAPAAGAQWTKAVPGDQAWIIRSVLAKLVTSGVAGTRSIALTFDDQTNVFAAATAAATQITGLTQTYAWMTDFGPNAVGVAGGFVSSALPELVLPPGFRINSAASAFDAGDQWSGIFLLVESLLTRPFGTRQIQEATRYGELVAPYATEPGAQ